MLELSAVTLRDFRLHAKNSGNLTTNYVDQPRYLTTLRDYFASLRQDGEGLTAGTGGADRGT